MKKAKRNYKVIVNWFDSLKGIGEGELTTGQHETVFLNAGNILSSGFKNLSSGEVISCELARNDDGNLYAVTIHKGKSTMNMKKLKQNPSQNTHHKHFDTLVKIAEAEIYTMPDSTKKKSMRISLNEALATTDIERLIVISESVKDVPLKMLCSYKIAMLIDDQFSGKIKANPSRSLTQVNHPAEIKKLMQALAYATETDFDGDPEDLRLHDQMINTRSLNFTKAQYKKMEDDINNFEIEGDGFGVYAFCDVSGYQYWTKNMKEDNYINIYVAIDENALLKDKLSPLAIMQAIDEARNHFSKYERIHY